MGITCVLPSSEMPISATAKIVHCQYWVLAYSNSTKHHNKALTSSEKTHQQEANYHGIHSQPRERRPQWQGTPTIHQTQPLPPFQNNGGQEREEDIGLPVASKDNIRLAGEEGDEEELGNVSRSISTRAAMSMSYSLHCPSLMVLVD